MKYISAQPDSDYFIWQLQVQMNNFRSHGIDERDMVILMAYTKKINQNAIKFAGSTQAHVHFYPDTRNDTSYIPSIRPHLLKKYFKDYNVEKWFYHDCDILFQKLPDFSRMDKEGVVYVSDTRSYLDSKYIISKGKDLFIDMCELMNIKPEYVIDQDSRCGGSQYYFSGYRDQISWEIVEIYCTELYHLMKNTNPGIQAWTADMWALLWTLWTHGIDTEISPELSFSWATSPISEWDKHNIYHNAGATKETPDLFLKSDYINKSPLVEYLGWVSDQYCSWKYVEEIYQTYEKRPNIYNMA